MHTVAVISLFALMVLSPCIAAQYDRGMHVKLRWRRSRPAADTDLR